MKEGLNHKTKQVLWDPALLALLFGTLSIASLATSGYLWWRKDRYDRTENPNNPQVGGTAPRDENREP